MAKVELRPIMANGGVEAQHQRRGSRGAAAPPKACERPSAAGRPSRKPPITSTAGRYGTRRRTSPSAKSRATIVTGHAGACRPKCRTSRPSYHRRCRRPARRSARPRPTSHTATRNGGGTVAVSPRRKEGRGGAAIIADVVSGAEGFGPSHSGHEKETPSMAERTLTAMYDDRTAAEAARDRLVALGVPSAGITIRGTDAGTTTTSAPAEEDKGFWASLADLFAPEEDRHAYAEGLRRGGHLLSARVPEGLEDRAIDLLETSGAGGGDGGEARAGDGRAVVGLRLLQGREHDRLGLVAIHLAFQQ